MLKQAIKLHQQGKLAEAEAIYQQLLTDDPHNCELLHALAIVSAQQAKSTHALNYINQAIKQLPDSPALLNSKGNIYKQSGNYAKAIRCYQQALKLNPQYAVVHNSLGTILHQQKLYDQAAQHYQAATKIKPDYADAHFNYALTLLAQQQISTAMNELTATIKHDPNHLAAHCKLAEQLHLQNNYDAAISHYKVAINLDPLNLDVYHNLGAIFLEQNNPLGALKYFLRILQLNKDFDAFYNVAVIYMYQDKFKDAIEYFHQALQIDPDNIACHTNLAAIYLKLRHLPEAINHYQQVLRFDHSNEEAKYILAALQHDNTPTTAPSSYIQNLFDQYAPYYDEHLQQALQYKAPELLYTAISQELSPENNQYNIVDLGCGTGLVGEKFKPLAKQLIGIDLAAKMIAIAQAKNVYDQLITAELHAGLKQTTKADLIIAADTLVYLGELTNLFKLCRAKLTENGIFAFTIEKTNSYPYELQDTARYAHSQQYIIELAANNNFQILTCNNIVLRQENNRDIEGYLYILCSRQG